MKEYIKLLVVAFVAALSLQACESFDEPGLLPQQPTVEDVGGSAYYSTFYLPKLWVLAESVDDGDIFDIKLELLPLAKRLNLDFNLGLGYWGGKYKEYLPIEGHYVWQSTKQRHWWGPTKAEVSLVWLLGKSNSNPQKGGRQ